MSQSGSEQTLRHAGLLERYYIARHHLGMFTCVVTSARYVDASRSSRVLDKPTLFAALAKVVRRHAALGVYLVGESSGKPAYARLRSIDLSQVVRYVEDPDASLQSILDTQIAAGFQTDRMLPLWRLHILSDHTVVFAWHHGIGGLAFHYSLLSALNEEDRSTTADSPAVLIPADIPIIDPVEHLTDLSVFLSTSLREILQILVPVSWTPLHKAWTGHQVPRVDSLCARMQLLEFSPPRTARILRLCRTHGASLTAVVHTLSTLIISEQLAADPATAGKFECLSTSIPVSLRRLTKTPPDELCNEVSTYHSYPPLIARPPGQSPWLAYFPWDVSAELTATLQKQIRESAEQTGMLKFLFGNYHGYFNGMLGKKRIYSLQISNLGRWPFSGDDLEVASSTPEATNGRAHSWVIDKMCFTQGLAASGAAIAINVTGTPAGGLSFSVLYGQDSIDDVFGESFFNALKAGIFEMADDSTHDQSHMEV